MGYIKEVLSDSRASTATGATTFTTPVTAAPSPGNSIIVHINSSVLPSSITDTKGNTYVKSTSTSPTTPANTNVSQWLCQQDVGALTTADSLTLHFPSNVFGLAMKVSEWSGLTASPLDQVASGVEATSTSARVAGTTPATTQANEAVIATIGVSGNETSWTPGAGYTSTGFVVNSTANRAVETEYAIVSATGTQSPTGTGGIFTTSAGITCTYKLSSTGNITPATSIAATSTVTGKVAVKHKIGGTVSAASTVGGTVTRPGQATVVSTYGAGIFGTAVYGSSPPPPTGIAGGVLATSVVSGAVSRLTAPVPGGGGGVYTPPYTPPTPPPAPVLGTFGPFAQAVYDLLNGDELSS